MSIGVYDISSENQANTNYAQCDDVSCILLKGQYFIEHQIGDVPQENTNTKEALC